MLSLKGPLRRAKKQMPRNGDGYELDKPVNSPLRELIIDNKKRLQFLQFPLLFSRQKDENRDHKKTKRTNSGFNFGSVNLDRTLNDVSN